MKKQLLLAILMTLPLTTWAYDVLVDGIYYNLSGNEAAVTNETGNRVSNSYSGSVSIPSSITYNGTVYNVTAIEDYAFACCYGLSSIEIPNSVTTIGDETFWNLWRLSSIEIPNSVTTIGDQAFYSCNGLAYVEMPNSVTSIGESAFSYCTGLTSVIIPNSVTSIGSSAFSDVFRHL